MGFKEGFNNKNKNMLTRSKYSTPQQRVYRSIRYKVCSSAIGTSDIETGKSLRESASHHKYRTTRTRLTKNTQEITSKTQLVSNPEGTNESFNFEVKKPYLDTWKRLLNSSKQTVQVEENTKGPRVCLPHIIEHEPSMFTALDPLSLPFAHIQQGIKELKGQLPGPKLEMAQIRADLRNIQGKVLKEVELTEKIAVEGFQKLRKMLRCDRVEYQQSTMRFQRHCQSLREKDEAFKQDFQSTKPRLDVLQEDIFSTRPFDLERDPGLDHQFPQPYF